MNYLSWLPHLKPKLFYTVSLEFSLLSQTKYIFVHILIHTRFSILSLRGEGRGVTNVTQWSQDVQTSRGRFVPVLGTHIF